MSLTSYQAAPPRVLIMATRVTKSNSNRFEVDLIDYKLAPEVGFEPTTNRLTADRSTTELLWITQLKTRVGIFAHDWLQATANALIGLQIDASGVAATKL